MRERRDLPTSCNGYAMRPGNRLAGLRLRLLPGTDQGALHLQNERHRRVGETRFGVRVPLGIRSGIVMSIERSPTSGDGHALRNAARRPH